MILTIHHNRLPGNRFLNYVVKINGLEVGVINRYETFEENQSPIRRSKYRPIRYFKFKPTGGYLASGLGLKRIMTASTMRALKTLIAETASS